MISIFKQQNMAHLTCVPSSPTHTTHPASLIQQLQRENHMLRQQLASLMHSPSVVTSPASHTLSSPHTPFATPATLEHERMEQTYRNKLDKIKKGHSRRNSADMQPETARRHSSNPTSPFKKVLEDSVEEVPSLMIVPPQGLVQPPPTTLRKVSTTDNKQNHHKLMGRTTPSGFPLNPTPQHSRHNSILVMNRQKGPNTTTVSSDKAPLCFRRSSKQKPKEQPTVRMATSPRGQIYVRTPQKPNEQDIQSTTIKGDSRLSIQAHLQPRLSRRRLNFNRYLQE